MISESFKEHNIEHTAYLKIFSIAFLAMRPTWLYSFKDRTLVKNNCPDDYRCLILLTAVELPVLQAIATGQPYSPHYCYCLFITYYIFSIFCCKTFPSTWHLILTCSQTMLVNQVQPLTSFGLMIIHLYSLLTFFEIFIYNTSKNRVQVCYHLPKTI